jgi:hypothetical protein
MISHWMLRPRWRAFQTPPLADMCAPNFMLAPAWTGLAGGAIEILCSRFGGNIGCA